MPRAHKKINWRLAVNHRYLYGMLLLPIIYYIVFCYVPMYGVTIAFRDYNLIKGVLGSPWVGLKYFNQYIADPYFWKRNESSTKAAASGFGQRSSPGRITTANCRSTWSTGAAAAFFG